MLNPKNSYSYAKTTARAASREPRASLKPARVDDNTGRLDKCEIAIIGGGPSGSTVATLVRKYDPDVDIRVFERETFPREHIGESQLPPITTVLDEMDVWDKVEAAGFPIKTGAMYRWGTSPDLWKLDFLVGEQFENNPRPERLRGQRHRTTFHVERGLYDKILLEHAASLGVGVRQGTQVVEVLRDGDRVEGIKLAGGEIVVADWYVDASGNSGILRRQMGVEVEEPTKLKNVAFWDYWTNPAWAETVCKGGVRARIFSLGYGWVWFIPLSTTRASVGLVTHGDYFKASGMRPAELYEKALTDDPFVSSIMPGATAEGHVRSTKDWSFTASRLCGENWFLTGECGGFADPILAAGMTLAHVGARELAYVLLELRRGKLDPEWLKSWYERLSLRRVRQHIRFADFWYSANSHFDDLKAYSAEIACDAGLSLNPDEAFMWLSQGGFATDTLSGPAFGSYELGPAKAVVEVLTGDRPTWKLNSVNDLKLNLVGAKQVEVPIFQKGKIEAVRCYERGSKLLPIHGVYRLVVAAVRHERDAKAILQYLRHSIGLPPDFVGYHPVLIHCLEAIEGMLIEGWLKGSRNKSRPMVRIELEQNSIALAIDDDDVQIERQGTERKRENHP